MMMVTLPMLVNRVPCDTLWWYNLVPMRKMVMETMRPIAGMP